MAHITKRATAVGKTRWDVRWKVLGRWQTKTFARRQDADAFRRTVEAEELRGVVVDVRRSSQQCAPFATEWLDTRRRPDGRALTPRTRTLYGDLLRRLILPTFGDAKLAAIQPALVRRWYGSVADTASPLQAAKAYRLLRTILNTAVRDGVLAVNPCNLEGGGVERSTERPLIDAEVVFDLAEAIDPRYRALILVVAFGPGSRQGEFRAYRRRHVDLLHGRIRTEVQEQIGPEGPVASAPKNDSARWTTLPPFVLDELRTHLDTYAQPGPEGYVFTGPTGGAIAPVHWYKSFRLAAGDRDARAAPARPAPRRGHLLRPAGRHDQRDHGPTRPSIPGGRRPVPAVRRDVELAAKLQSAAEEAQARRGRRSHR
jgi:integrase